jgi:C-terminal processing protease CtpA/Prc
MIEGKAVVTALRPGDASVAAAGLHVGDVIVAADGEPVEARLAKASKYTPASNESWRAFRALGNTLTGDDGSTLRLAVRDASGVTRDVQVARTTDWEWRDRSGPVYRLLDDGIGYADLDRLENADVDAMLAAFEKTRAIVFDMRGYPHATAWTIGPRLNVRHARVAAQFFEPLVEFRGPDRTFFEQPVGFADKPLYHGKTVMLVDERTMSQAEHTGLFFEAANGTKFIGSQTAGANGDITNLSIPGGYFVSFSGHDVRHADGRQLQRVGLVPDVEVHPTLVGIRAGRDEVLERAVEYLRSGK